MNDHDTARAARTTNGKSSAHTHGEAEATHRRTPTLEDRVAEQIATWFGCGRVPRAPGTAGALAAVPLHWAFSRLAPGPHLLAVLAVSAAGIWASGKRADYLCEKDPQSIVVDEVAGTLIALGLVRRRSLAVQLAALILFRVFDVAKPGPVDAAQHAKPIGLGIMADDFLAGILAGVVAKLLPR